MTASQATSPKVGFGQAPEGAATTPGFGRAGAVAGVALVVVVLGGLLWSANAGPAASAEHMRFFGGSLVLEDQRQLTVIDVATGAVVAGLQSVNSQVGASAEGDVQAVPISTGTMLIDRRTGTFNELGQDNYVVDPAGSGVGLGPLRGLSGASGLAAGDAAYIVRFAPRSTVSLVDQSTVAAAAKLGAPAPAPGGSGRGAKPAGAGPAPAVTPPGFAALDGPVIAQSGSAAVSGHDLWALVGAGASCQVTQLRPVATGRNGLVATRRAGLAAPCESAAVEAGPGVVGVASPGLVRLFTYNPHTGQPARQIEVPTAGTRADRRFLPVGGTTGMLWYLAQGAGGAAGWSVFGVSPTGKVTGPSPLARFSGNAQPAPPVESAGLLYSLDQASRGQPILWTIVPATGAMIPVSGLTNYPARGPTEKASFTGAEVVVDGPRVVFNNPGSLLAVVVFTDGTRPPVIVDKSSAVAVSTVGPTVAGGSASTLPGARRATTTNGPPPAGPPAAAVVQPVNPAVTCASTTQKPYAPQITSVEPSSGSALVAWSYQLLDQGDCEPDSWAVTVRALTSTHQPAQPVQVVNRQTQLQFSGLRPATTYQVTVTAYINAQSTASTPATFTTAARGPDAPVAVHTTADGKGNWVVSWQPCAAASCVVPASAWNVTGTACGSSFVGRPPAVQVPAGHDSVILNAGDLGLLGDSLSFAVQGVLPSGLTGVPASDHTCTEAWEPPNAAAIHLSDRGTRSPDGQSVTATLLVSTSGLSPAAAFGSSSTEFMYHVGGRTIGPTLSTQVTVPGLAGGTSYTPTVSVYPAAHPSAVAVITGPPFTQNLQWPADLGVTPTPVVSRVDPNVGSLLLSFPNLPPGPMAAAGNIQCASTQVGVSGALADSRLTVTNLNLVDLGGRCNLAMTVSDTLTPDPYGVPWQSAPTAFTLGTQPAYAFSDRISPLCQEHFCPPGEQQVQVVFSGPGPQPTAGGNWTITSSGGDGDCASSLIPAPPVLFPITIGLPPRCRHASGVDVTVTYEYLGQTVTVPLGPPLGTPGTTTTSTTSTTSTTTTTTTVPASSTSSSPTTSASAPTSPPVTAAGAVAPSGRPAELASAHAPVLTGGQAPAVAGDPEVRTALGWGLLTAGAAGAGYGGLVWRARRRSPRRGRRG